MKIRRFLGKFGTPGGRHRPRDIPPKPASRTPEVKPFHPNTLLLVRCPALCYRLSRPSLGIAVVRHDSDHNRRRRQRLFIAYGTA
jgi:hypothetical protein